MRRNYTSIHKHFSREPDAVRQVISFHILLGMGLLSHALKSKLKPYLQKEPLY